MGTEDSGGEKRLVSQSKNLLEYKGEIFGC
jgi:hypothetical protein